MCVVIVSDFGSAEEGGGQVEASLQSCAVAFWRTV